MSNTSNDPISEILLKYTADLMAGLDKSHFPREEQTKIYTEARQAISKLLLEARHDEWQKIHEHTQTPPIKNYGKTLKGWYQVDWEYVAKRTDELFNLINKDK